MSVRKKSSCGDVLHIRPDWSDQATEIDAMLLAESLSVEVSPDVYRGLARICADRPSQSSTGPALRAVLVCVDDFGPAELEFFSIVSRVRRAIPVLVYGQERYNFRVAKAIELGATGTATADAIRSIAPAHAPSPPEPLVGDDVDLEVVADSPPLESTPVEAVHPQPVEAIAEPVDTVPEPVPESKLEPEAPPIESDTEKSAPAKDRNAGRRARVPWQRYTDGPTRTAPRRPPPSEPTVPEEEPEPSLTEDLVSPLDPLKEPLLTQAELQALLGDDISAIAPEERTESASGEMLDKEGTS